METDELDFIGTQSSQQEMVFDLTPPPKPDLDALEALKQLGFHSFRPGQEDIIRKIVEPESRVLAVCPTGWGKSMLYMVPSIACDGMALIVSPLISLMKDQVDKLKSSGVSVEMVNSTLTLKEVKRVLTAIQLGQVKILYVAPERFSNDEFMRVIRDIPIGLFAVDECHCISRWGHDFRPAYKRLGDVIKNVKPKRVAALTATATKRVRDDIVDSLGIPGAKMFIRGVYRSNLCLSAKYIDTGNRLRLIRKAIQFHKNKGHETGIIYAPVRRKVEELAMALDAVPYHAGLNNDLRKQVQEEWSENGGIIVATCAFGMGIDRSDVRFVYHWGLSPSIEDWYQECVHPDSLISTENGIKIAKKVVLGDNMPNLNLQGGCISTAMVVREMEHGAKKLVEIRTKLGSTMLVSATHPIGINTSSGLKKVPAGDVSVGDRLFAILDMAPADPVKVLVLELLRDSGTPLFVGVTKSFIEKAREVVSVSEFGAYFNLARSHDYAMYSDGKKAGPLEAWMRLISDKGLSVQEFAENILFFKSRSGGKTVLPVYLDSDLAWLSGIMATDGYIYRSDKSGFGSWKLKLGTVTPAIMDRFKAVIHKCGLSVHHYVRKPKDGGLAKKDINLLEVSSPVLVSLLQKMGIPTGKKTYTVRVPQFLLRTDDFVRGGYLAGVIDGDGSICNDRSIVRVHAASWEYISGLCMMLRTFRIPASVFVEDYLKKRDVMQAASDFGYSLQVTSTDHYMALRESVMPFAAKEWTERVRKPNSHWGSLREKAVVGSSDCLIDEVYDVREIDYDGSVLNWTVEPGNQLWVNGILTHNCGRAGRDGNDAECCAFWDFSDLRTQQFLLDLSSVSSWDAMTFAKWLKSIACSKARPGMKTVTLNMTQSKMGDLSNVKGVSPSLAFLRKHGLVDTVGRGKYQVNVEKNWNLDFSELDALRKYKEDKLEEVANLYKERYECRFANVCAYFDDLSFTGRCGKCDICRAQT